MKKLLHGILLLRNSPLVNRFKITDRRIKLQETRLALDVTQNCSAFNLPLKKKFSAENFVIFFYEIKLLVTLLT